MFYCRNILSYRLQRWKNYRNLVAVICTSRITKSVSSFASSLRTKWKYFLFTVTLWLANQSTYWRHFCNIHLITFCRNKWGQDYRLGATLKEIRVISFKAIISTHLNKVWETEISPNKQPQCGILWPNSGIELVFGANYHLSSSEKRPRKDKHLVIDTYRAVLAQREV